MKLIAAAALALLLPQEKNEAEDLFRKMEMAVLRAKTLSTEFETTPRPAVLRGQLILGENNQIHLRVHGNLSYHSLGGRLVSNGTRLQRSSGSSMTFPQDVAPEFNERFRLNAARAGIMHAFDTGFAPGKHGEVIHLASDFKLGAQEDLGGRHAKTVDYILTFKKTGTRESARVWIDVESHLPLKRTLCSRGVTWTETHAPIRADGSVDPAMFVVLPLAQEKNEAEGLFKRMEAKLEKARSVRVKSSGSAEMSEGEMTLSTDLYWETGDRVRLDGDTSIPELGRQTFLYISDGTHVTSTEGDEKRSGKSPPKLSSDLARSWARAGSFFVALWVDAATFKDDAHPKRSAVPKCKSFKFGPKEKVGGRDAQKVEYTLTEVESGEVSMAVWIDSETLLPVKRELRGFHKQEEMTFVETYSGFKLDEKIDPATFEFPKEAK